MFYCFQNRVFSEALKKPRLVFSKALEKYSPLLFPASAVLDVVCSFLFLSLSPTPLRSSLLPELACVRTRQSCDANARFCRVFF